MKFHKGSTAITIVLTVVITLLIVGVGYLYYQNRGLREHVREQVTEAETKPDVVTEAPGEDKKPDATQPENKTPEPEDKKPDATQPETPEPTSASPCDFTKDVTYKATTKYGIFGDDEFDTAVCGYLLTRQEEIFGETFESAYFVITKYMDDGFRDSIMQGINSGNSINQLHEGNVIMGIGCIENGSLINQGNTGIDTAAANSIMASAKTNPIALKFSFEVHGGFGAACAGLMEGINLY